MLEYRTAPSAQCEILGHFRRRAGHGHGQHLHNVARHLMEVILARRDFDDLDSLIVFCEAPDNLRPWLPSEADRIIFSDMLAEGLRELPADKVGLTP